MRSCRRSSTSYPWSMSPSCSGVPGLRLVRRGLGRGVPQAALGGLGGRGPRQEGVGERLVPQLKGGRMPHLTVNGVRIFYDEQGSGPPLLLISGLGANRLSWVPVVPLLKDSFRCITFDNRGVGQSDVPPGPYTID